MSILKQIKENQVQARKERDKFKTGVLTALAGEVAVVGKNNGNRETNDTEAIKVITKFAKGVEETINLVKDEDKIKELEKELEIYKSYLPKQMTEEELVTKIGIFLQTETNPNMGSVMKYLKENFEGEYNGKMASKIVKELLN